MNVGDKSSNDLLFINFNQDFSCISVGTRTGYKIYNCDPFGKCYAKEGGGMGVVEMLFCTSLVALVGAGEQPGSSPRRLQIVNTKRQSTICELTFPTTILAVKLNRRRLVVVVEEQIYVYDISNMKLIHTIETSPNPQAVCALSPSSENCYLIYPSPSPASSGSPFSTPTDSVPRGTTTTGDVLIFDALSLQVVNIIQAHKSPLSCVATNAEGTLMATASDKGTVIRVFTVPDGQKLYQFRRGSYPARIHCLSFNLVSSLLCVSSEQETVHIFRLSDTAGGDDAMIGSLGRATGGSNESNGGRSSVGKMLRASSIKKAVGKNVAGYLPDMLTEMWEPVRDFAHLKLKSSGVQSLVALCNSTPQVMVVTSEGYLYVYNIDLEKGGECALTKQYCLIDPNEDVTASMMGE
ncbi:WD40 repeat-like protein [Thamnocephalis sphaerospora]|uniref:Autophagy-related protein 18 n=1 Tax=Thamnocephalis sphaerospora TaxID=78915 RepID=A0A4P9XGT7_9FUNG|nr:WD40 repeat-like protein [Thamnocephalis sphaerospora]|eukprot:RKP04865.1 WD40 repeat-like protein [Thamnocephalis sphaerospora]